MNKRVFSIGEMARLFHLSVSSIRHYESCGLIKPEYVDPDTGYRYYSPRQFESFNTIRYLRALDMPLDDIEDFLHDRDIDKIEEKLSRQKVIVSEKQQELARIERKIIFLGKVGFSISEQYLKEKQYAQYDGTFLLLDEADRFDGALLSLPETLCVRVRFHGHHLQSPEQYRKLEEFIREHYLQICGFSREITLIDYGITNDTEKFVTEICIPVKCE